MNARRRFLFAITAAAALALAACDVPTVPDFTYYRLPRPTPLKSVPTPLFGDVVVDTFSADGLYGDQALVYALEPSAQQLRQYHYQLWTDPPARVLQRRLIEQLRDANVATRVIDELPASHPAVRITGTILRFDRAPNGTGGYTATVALKLRADDDQGLPMLDDYYRAELPADGNDVKASVDAYGAALDKVFAQFYVDLCNRGGPHAG
ncbi:MAG: ABC-type transport auxiliary lipoprotein family protein [Rhodanobacteraceae bacterium]